MYVLWFVWLKMMQTGRIQIGRILHICNGKHKFIKTGLLLIWSYLFPLSFLIFPARLVLLLHSTINAFILYINKPGPPHFAPRTICGISCIIKCYLIMQTLPLIPTISYLNYCGACDFVYAIMWLCGGECCRNSPIASNGEVCSFKT